MATTRKPAPAVSPTSTIPARNIFMGNVMYINPKTKPNAEGQTQEYVTVMVRFKDNGEIPEVPVGLFLPMGTLKLADNVEVGDMVAFAGTDLREGKTTLGDDGPIVSKVRGFLAGSFTLALKTAKKVDTTPVAPISEGMSNVVDGVKAKLLGLFGKK